jgi:hypothetical protein
MPARQSTHADRGLLLCLNDLRARHGRGIGSAWITAYSPGTLFPLLDRVETIGYLRSSSKAVAVNATRVSHNRKGRRAMAAAKARGSRVFGEPIAKD